MNNIPKSEWDEFHKHAEAAHKAMSQHDDETHESHFHHYEHLDKPLQHAIDNHMSDRHPKPDQEHFEKALEAGHQKDGTEPRAALDAATHAYKKVAKKYGSTNEDTQLDEISKTTLGNYVKLHKASFGVHPEDDNTEIHHVQKTSKGTMHVVWSHPDHNDDERGNYHVSAFKHDGKKGDYAGGGPESSHHSEEDAISHAKSLKKSTNEDTQLDEISKTTLGNYVKKARKSVDSLTTSADQERDWGNSYANQGTHPLAAKSSGIASNLYKKAGDRLISMKKANSRLTKEDISDMIDQLVDGNTEQAQQAFDAAIGIKVIDALDSLKLDVAQNLYK